MSQHHFLDICEGMSFATSARSLFCQIGTPKHNVLTQRQRWLASSRMQQVPACQKPSACLVLGGSREGEMNGHLVPIKVSVKG